MNENAQTPSPNEPEPVPDTGPPEPASPKPARQAPGIQDPGSAAPDAERPGGGLARGNRKRVVGVVVSDKCDKTISVRVTRLVKHPRYGKYIRRSTKFTAHDARNEAHEGDRVEIMETRPLSKKKRWRLISVVERARA